MPTHVQGEPIPFDFLPGFQAPLTNEDGSAGHSRRLPSLPADDRLRLPDQEPRRRDHQRRAPAQRLDRAAARPARQPRRHPGALHRGRTDQQRAGCPPNPRSASPTSPPWSARSAATPSSPPPSTTWCRRPARWRRSPPTSPAPGLFAHVLVGVRSDSDYGIETAMNDTIAFGQQPIFNVQAQVWGDPSAEAHDGMRGECAEDGSALCPRLTPSKPPS